jgi:hypothetical protein
VNADKVVIAREHLATGVGTTTRRNKVLPAPILLVPIPERIGKAGPRLAAGDYIEFDYALRTLENDNAMTYQYEMLNTPLIGDMVLYLQPRPRDTTAGDSNYFPSAVKLTTTDSLLTTDYQLPLQAAIIRPIAGADRIAGFVAVNPVSEWFPKTDIVRGPTGVHAMVRKAKVVDMFVDGVDEKLYLKPPPYAAPAGNGLCVLDQITKLGDPWHGLIQGGTMRLPNGATRPAARPGLVNGNLYALVPYGVTPTESADAADVAAGRTWLNYGLLAGFCLYEQSIAVYGASWVYIAPDNSTWRVQYTHSFDLGVWGLSLRFYPLRRTFLTLDKGGGLVQTIFAPINPSSSAYRNGVLYDIDSKGANAVLFNDFGVNRGASLINIQGIPPAATATNTLLCDGSPAGNVYSMSKRVISSFSKKTWLYQTLRFNEVTGESIFGPETEYTQDQLIPDPEPPDFLPPLPQPDFPWSLGWRIGWKETKQGSTVSTELIIGYAFDAADNLQEVLYVTVEIYASTEKPIAGNEYAFRPPSVVTGDGGSYTHYTKIGGVVSDPVEWLFDGITLANATPNAYGEFFIYGVGNITLNVERYTNRVYGMAIRKIGETHFNYLPPVSPDGPSPYVADIVSAFKPFATYHPIKQLLVWETGFVQFI